MNAKELEGHCFSGAGNEFPNADTLRRINAELEECKAKLAVRTPGSATGQKFTGFIRRGGVLHLYGTADAMRAAMSAEPVDWSEACWLDDVVIHDPAGKGGVA